MVGSPDGKLLYQDFVAGDAREAEALGAELAQKLLEQGASALLTEGEA